MLSDDLYQRFAALVRERAGLHYPPQRRADLAYGLQRAAQQLGVADLHQLLALIERSPAAWNDVIAELTIGETYFFRNAAQFAALREIILPDLIQRRAMVRYLRLWSAGCATGEEPYSLAITLRETLPVDPPWQMSILATDINHRFLERAREAVYGSWSFRETPEHVRDRYFIPEGGRWRLRDEIKRDVVFAHLNLVEPSYPSPQLGIIAFDIIFCRNVLIYFDEATTQQIVQRLYDALTPGGWLVVGHAEPNIEFYRQFETHNAPGTVLYRKPLHAPPFIPATAVSPPSPKLVSPPLPAPPQIVAQPTQLTPSPEAWLQQARAAADHGDWSAARMQVQALLKAYPLFAPAYYLQGQIAEHHGHLDEALADYRRSVYLDPHFVLGLIGMASIFARQSQPDAARRALRQAAAILAQHPDDQIVDPFHDSTAAEVLAYINLLWQQIR
ncbi:CheR family methyltransferase [Chloroflexus sp.]|uniref:CheR family methyltransferase n=1 Tax=Chloroflexus sp. TaxID=1904827 RepID=UPI00298EEBD5|nr:CheR family methyltransferase [Chloroflexus sp.]MCS6888577.1 tetratricopeptide repeat protein [Chloroflexus sp.]MCX7860523.1 tetratricopeptide repeat protein [Chloroflexus sp.]MDW8404175.1 CheR family methyltransferase [Chloroflexus sp.]